MSPSPTWSEWLPWLLQLNDSQFPSGAYAHSLGLEGLVQAGFVASSDDLQRFLLRQVVPSLLALELPFLARAHAAAAASDALVLAALDGELDAWKIAAELRAASRQIGSRRLALVRKLGADPFVEAYAAAGHPCHHLTACALELRHAPGEAAAAAFAYQTLSGYALAAMKLLRLGQEKAQTLVRGALLHLLEQPRTTATPPGRTGWFNPLLEIASLRHAHAHERLFIS